MKRVLIVILMLIMAPCSLRADEGPLPYYDEIMHIVNSLEYSGFEVLVKPDISMTLDFNKRSWTLNNIHQYDAQGGIILEQGRYGLCAELSTYLYQKLQSILPHQYDIKFGMVTEAGFFPTYQSNHIVLLMYDPSSRKTYLIDPSFHKYGNIKSLSDYQILSVQEALSFVKDKSHNVSFLADQAMPLFIKEDLMLSFSVTTVDGKFDKDNFLFVISANRKNKISGLNLLVVGKYNGHAESFEGRNLLAQFLNQQEIDNLHKKIEGWIQQN